LPGSSAVPCWQRERSRRIAQPAFGGKAQLRRTRVGTDTCAIRSHRTRGRHRYLRVRFRKSTQPDRCDWIRAGLARAGHLTRLHTNWKEMAMEQLVRNLVRAWRGRRQLLQETRRVIRSLWAAGWKQVAAAKSVELTWVRTCSRPVCQMYLSQTAVSNNSGYHGFMRVCGGLGAGEFWTNSRYSPMKKILLPPDS